MSLLSECVTKSDTIKWISHFLVTHSFFFDRLNQKWHIQKWHIRQKWHFQKKGSDRLGVLRNQNLLTDDEKARFESVTFNECVTFKVTHSLKMTHSKPWHIHSKWHIEFKVSFLKTVTYSFEYVKMTHSKHFVEILMRQYKMVKHNFFTLSKVNFRFNIFNFLQA